MEKMKKRYFLEDRLQDNKSMSEKRGKKIDKEIRKFVEKGYEPEQKKF